MRVSALTWTCRSWGEGLSFCFAVSGKCLSKGKLSIMFVDLDGEWPRENPANSAPKSFPFICVAAAWETARLTFSLLSVSYLPQACWATSGPLNACILRSNWRCAYTNNGVTCSVYRSLGGGKEHIKKLTCAKRHPPKKPVTLVACGAGHTVKQCWTEWRETPASPTSLLGTEPPETLTQSHGSISNRPHWHRPKGPRKSSWNPHFRSWCSRSSWECWSRLSLRLAAGSTRR